MHRLYRLLRALFRLALSIAALAVIGVAGTWLWQTYSDYHARAASFKQYGALVDSTRVWVTSAPGGTAVVKLKCISDNKILYQFDYQCKEGTLIESCTGFTVALLDGDGFEISSFTVRNFVRIVDGTGADEQWTGISARGEFYIDLATYAAVSATAGSGVVTFVVPKPQSAPRLRKVEPSTSNTTSQRGAFEAEIEQWNNKAQKILKGMTFQEMINAAGPARTYTNAYKYGQWATKYNYGDYWVYYKDNLVEEVVREPRD